MKGVFVLPKRKPPANDWQARDVKDWTAITFHAYMKDLHLQKYGTPYIVNNRTLPIQNKNIKRLYEEYGKEVVKRFIEICFDNIKPSSGYASVTFNYCLYFKDKYLPVAVRDVKMKQQKIETEQKAQEKWKNQDIQSIIDNF